MDIISFHDVWEKYRIKFIIKGEVHWEDFWALSGVNFSVTKGEAVGLIGDNGAGKTTVLKLISGMIPPDRGEVRVCGRVNGLLELGSGFQVELTGEENVRLHLDLYGLADEVDKATEIISFSGLGRFIYAPVKCYSHGMFVRLAFSIAAHLDSDILVIDDILTVGDESFQRKCLNRIFEAKERGVTVILATHDMSVLKRFSKRAILLRGGCLAFDGDVSCAVRVYIQGCGMQGTSGISSYSLSKGAGRIVVNKGKLFLIENDKMIISSSGAGVNFIIDEVWYGPSDADWSLVEQSEGLIVLRGNFLRLGIELFWKIEYVSREEIYLEIWMEVSSSLKVREVCFNFSLSEPYGEWFTLFQNGPFDSGGGIIADKWEGLLRDRVFSPCLVAKPDLSSGDGLPVLSLELSGKTAKLYSQAVNACGTGILQYRAIFNPDDIVPCERISCFSGRIVLGLDDINAYLYSIREKFLLASRGSCLSLENGKLIVGDDHLFRGGRMFFSASVLIASGERRYHSEDADWVVEKGTNWMLLKGRDNRLPIEYVWKVSVSEEDEWSWNVALNVLEEVRVNEVSMLIKLPAVFSRYETILGSGIFPDVFGEYYYDVLQRCVTDGSFLFSSADGSCSSLCFSFQKHPYTYAKIFNSDLRTSMRVLSVNMVFPEDKICLEPGRHDLNTVSGGIKHAIESLRENAFFSAGEGVDFGFENGRGRIICNGKEITKRLGFYTSLRISGRWYDSASHASWMISRQGGRLRARGKWLCFPIMQEWVVFPSAKGTVDVEITMEITEALSCDRFQANLMLSEMYDEWSAGNGSGKFFGFYGDIDDDWEVIHSSSDVSDVVLTARATKNGLPSVSFLRSGSDFRLKANIVNSDLYHRGRVLQYIDSNDLLLSPGRYEYFRGQMLIKE